jgi:signal transduction histidine kinase/ActR/RegA family two-component response regulator
VSLVQPGLRSRLILLLVVALLPGFALLAWLRAEMHQIQTTELERSVVQLAQLAAEGQASRNHGAGQLLTALAANPIVRSGDLQGCGEFFHALIRQAAQAYANFGLLAPNGDLLCAGVSPVGPLNVGERVYFRETVRTRRLFVSNLAIGRITARPIITYTLPVLDGERLLGVVFASIDVTSLTNSLARVQLPEGGVIAILDRTGAFAARYPIAPQKDGDSRIALPTPSHDGAFVRLTTGIDGRERLYAAMPVDSERTMYAAAGLPTASGIHAADSRLTVALLILLGCSVIVFSVALVGAEYEIRRPIMRVLTAVTRFGSGELDARAGEVGGAGELRQLGRGFDRMADLLSTREMQVRQSQRLEAVGQLAGGVAHDFNNILTAIIGFSDELRDHVSSPVGSEHLREVLAAADRAKDLTRQLLAFSRRQVLQPTSLQLNAVIAGFTGLLQRVIGEDIMLVTKFGPELGHVLADRSQIEQVLMNLVVNARDAMPDGGMLAIETENVTLSPGDALPDAVGEVSHVPPGEYVRLIVSDSGSGIDAETQARMFEPFFSTKGQHGTGLGLAMVYGIVRQSGGHVSCWSEIGVGTAFCVMLPRRSPAPESPAPQASPPQAPAGIETILVVEDEPSVRTLAATVLRHRGYSVVEAGSGEAAIRHLDGGLVPDLLLCDLVMPGMNGHQVAAAIRTRHEAVRVLYMSGYEDHRAFSEASMDDVEFIQKPFTPDALARQVRATLDGGIEAACIACERPSLG